MENIKLLAITDIHHGLSFETKKSDAALSLLDKFVSYSNKVKPDLIVDLGDRINDIDREIDYSLMEDVAAKFKQVASRREHLLGNHDVKFLTPAENESILEAPVKSRSFDIGDWHLIFWSPNAQYTAQYGFSNDNDGILWLEDDLQRHPGRSVLFCHVPPFSGQLTGNYWFEENPWASRFPYADQVLNLLAEHPGLQMTVGGHLHWPRLNTLHGIHHITLPSLIESFYTNDLPCQAWTEITIGENIQIKISGTQRWEWQLPLRPHNLKWPNARSSARPD